MHIPNIIRQNIPSLRKEMREENFIIYLSIYQRANSEYHRTKKNPSLRKEMREENFIIYLSIHQRANSEYHRTKHPFSPKRNERRKFHHILKYVSACIFGISSDKTSLLSEKKLEKKVPSWLYLSMHQRAYSEYHRTKHFFSPKRNWKRQVYQIIYTYVTRAPPLSQSNILCVQLDCLRMVFLRKRNSELSAGACFN